MKFKKSTYIFCGIIVLMLLCSFFGPITIMKPVSKQEFMEGYGFDPDYTEDGMEEVTISESGVYAVDMDSVVIRTR